MNLREILEQETGQPVDRGTTTAENPPYIIFVSDDSRITGSDNVSYHSFESHRIEYYWTQKNREMERKIERALTKNEIYFEKSGDIHIPTEKMWATYYYI